MNIVDLPNEIFQLISEFSNTEFEIKQLKNKKLRIPKIKYKCEMCHRFRNFNHIEVKDRKYIRDVCRNNKNCDKYIEDNYASDDEYPNWVRYCDIREEYKYTERYGINYEHKMKKDILITEMNQLFKSARLVNKKTKQHKFDRKFISRCFFHSIRTPIEKVNKISKLVDVFTNIEGNEIYTK